MNPAPLHIRQVVNEDETSVLRVYVNGKFYEEVDDLTPGDMARLFADIYGMPVTMDASTPAEEQPTVITQDHLEENKFVLFEAITYPSEVMLKFANQMIGRAITLKLVEAAKEMNMAPNLISKALRFVDNPQGLGNERVYALQRMIDPTFAQFPALLAWEPGSALFMFDLGDVEVRQGEFARGGLVKFGEE